MGELHFFKSGWGKWHMVKVEVKAERNDETREDRQSSQERAFHALRGIRQRRQAHL